MHDSYYSICLEDTLLSPNKRFCHSLILSSGFWLNRTTAMRQHCPHAGQSLVGFYVTSLTVLNWIFRLNFATEMLSLNIITTCIEARKMAFYQLGRDVWINLTVFHTNLISYPQCILVIFGYSDDKSFIEI